jgi:CheY-like chemotaxis protein
MVLVADDDLDERMLFRRLLEREGFQVEEATDGQMALDRARELRPDLILMDVQMPRVDGFTAVERLRHDVRTARIPIIVVTAAARKPADVARGLGLGADDYLSKPFSVEEFVARASSKIRARRLEEKLRRRTEELEALVRIGSELNEALALEDLADRILAAIKEQIPAASALLVLVGGPERPPLQRLLGGDSHDSDLMAPDTLPGYVLECGEAVLIVDAIGDKRVRAIINGTKCRAGMATPLRHHGQILGVLALGDPAPGCFTPGNLRLLRSIGEQAALALRNAQLYTQLQEYAQDLESKVEARTAALQSAQLHLMRAEKMAALGTLAAGIAHEVNNPLQPILTNLEMALEDVQEARPIDVELLEFAKQDVQRIQRIVSRLLDFARPTQPEPIRVDVMRSQQRCCGWRANSLNMREWQSKRNTTPHGTSSAARTSSNRLF